MFTQAMPAFIDALRQAVPAAAVGPLAQSLGNCAQPLSHRAGVNFVNAPRPGVNGTFGSGAWDPAQYQNLFPGGNPATNSFNSANYHNSVDVGGMSVAWNEGNRYDSQFYFPTNQVFQQNQYYGGPVVHVAGGGDIDYITNQVFEGDTVTANDLTTGVFNGDPVAGPQGPPGAPGKDGQRGAPGAPGGFFGALPPGFFRGIRYLTGRPRVRFLPERVARRHRYIKETWIRKPWTVNVPTNAISGATVTVSPGSADVDVPTNAISGGTIDFSSSLTLYEVPATVSFDPDTCTVTVESTTSFYAFSASPGPQTVSGEAASTQTISYAATSSVEAVVTGIPAATVSVIAATTAASTLASAVASTGFVVKGADADFWERNPASVVVARDPRLVGAIPADARVYQQ